MKLQVFENKLTTHGMKINFKIDGWDFGASLN